MKNLKKKNIKLGVKFGVTIFYGLDIKMTNHLWNTHPKGNSKGSRSCRVCNGRNGLIRKYDLMVCRRCFREQAEQIGFKKYR
ncbi:hypothetical protein SteCoe_31530 [Stentor coeruleus]|uniref:40S ribosomal protein S29 n=1 Tax=Stentor coeruleus TaxID=5963 RepID=A0A1R2B1B0_9CILI|nr:hypothetical protein SteCoe_31530 [Stentor coeruleus]